MKRDISATLLGLLSIFLLAACEEEQAVIAPHMRAIKTFTVTDVAKGQVLRFPGKVEAADSSSLSFANSGTVAAVQVRAGDRVKKGQTLASLDTKSQELDVQAAEAELEKARSIFKEKEQDYRRKNELFGKGWVARAALEQAQAAMETARSDVGFATAKLNIEGRTLEDAHLRAPFDGLISERRIDPFVEVTAGQRALVLNAGGALDVAFTVPEKTISRLYVGMPATVDLTSLKDTALSGRVIEMGAKADTGNLFPIRISLERFPPTVRAGMTAEVTLTVVREDQPKGYLIPISAIAPGDEQAKGYVFVFHPDSSTVRRMPIEPLGARDNLIAVSGVEADDQIASAGVTFLNDKQKVKLMSWPLR